MISRELGLLLVVVILGTYWLTASVVVAHNVYGRPHPPLVTIATAPGAVPVLYEEDTP